MPVIEICNICQLCRKRNGDFRKNDELFPVEPALDMIFRIYNNYHKNQIMIVPDTVFYRELQHILKKQGYNVRIKNKQIIL